MDQHRTDLKALIGRQRIQRRRRRRNVYPSFEHLRSGNHRDALGAAESINTFATLHRAILDQPHAFDGVAVNQHLAFICCINRRHLLSPSSSREWLRR